MKDYAKEFQPKTVTGWPWRIKSDAGGRILGEVNAGDGWRPCEWQLHEADNELFTPHREQFRIKPIMPPVKA